MLRFLPSGTTANEALHHELSARLDETLAMHKAALKCKLRIFLVAKLTAHHAASFHNASRQIEHSMLSARTLGSRSVWAKTT